MSEKKPTVRPIFLVLLGAAVIAAIWRKKDVMQTIGIIKKEVFRANYGNERTKPIDTIVLHTAEGIAGGTINWFNMDHGKGKESSAHYLVDKNGKIYSFVPDNMVAYHAGDFGMNNRSIGIELEGFSGVAATFTPALIGSLIGLVTELTKKYSIPLDRTHIIGHNEVLYNGKKGGAGGHTDPGPFFPWDDFMKRLKTPFTQA